jgi:hypothetical protein
MNRPSFRPKDNNPNRCPQGIADFVQGVHVTAIKLNDEIRKVPSHGDRYVLVEARAYHGARKIANHRVLVRSPSERSLSRLTFSHNEHCLGFLPFQAPETAGLPSLVPKTLFRVLVAERSLYLDWETTLPMLSNSPSEESVWIYPRRHGRWGNPLPLESLQVREIYGGNPGSV